MKISDYPKWQNAENVRETDGNILKDNKQYKNSVRVACLGHESGRD